MLGQILFRFAKTVFVFLISILLVKNATGQTEVLTQHNDLSRTGLNPKETSLNVKNVNAGSFGQIFSRSVDDQIYTQPLVVADATTTSSRRKNLVIVATVFNTVYAFNADDESDSTPVWKSNLTYVPGNGEVYRPVKNSDIIGACGSNYLDFSGYMGIVGTPVIDPNSHTLYVVSRSINPVTRNFVQYLHALDVHTGFERANSPKFITATVQGIGRAQINGVITFDQQLHNQRPSLLLYKNVVYIAWASHCDWGPYHGWMMGYDASTLEQKYVYNDTKNGEWGGIWMSGQAPAVDNDGNIYIATGNGTTGIDSNSNDTSNRGESLLKLSTATGQLAAVDFFTPANYGYLNQFDLDYGSDGVFLMPKTNYSLSGSKEGYLYLINNSKMGGTTKDNSNVVQLLDVNVSSQRIRNIHGAPVYCQINRKQENIYVWGAGGFLKQLPFDRTVMKFDTLNKKVGNTMVPWNVPGGMLSASSNGGRPNSGIIWATHLLYGEQKGTMGPGMLQALDAADITHELWNSNMIAGRDSLGLLSKFAPPTIANGKVYVSTFGKRLVVYGLNPSSVSGCSGPLPKPWQTANIGYSAIPGNTCFSQDTFLLTASGEQIDNYNDNFQYLYLAPNNDFDLSCSVSQITANSDFAKCGISIRRSLDPRSPMVSLFVEGDGSLVFQERKTQNSLIDSSSKSAGLKRPMWLKIMARGNLYKAYASVNGRSWSFIDSTTISLGGKPFAGIGFTSNDNTQLSSALVTDVVLRYPYRSFYPEGFEFNGTNVDNRFTKLNWKLALGSGKASYFEIQKSSTDNQFQTIEKITTQDTARSFGCRDMSPLNGVNCYRLKVVNEEGSIFYSQVVEVNFNFENISIYPNPATKMLNFTNNNSFSKNAPLFVEMFSPTGQLVFSKKYETGSKTSDVIDLSFINSSGLYIVSFTNSEAKRQAYSVIINK